MAMGEHEAVTPRSFRQRKPRRLTRLRPTASADHVSSTAHSLCAASPYGVHISKISGMDKSLAAPDAFLGQRIHHFRPGSNSFASAGSARPRPPPTSQISG